MGQLSLSTLQIFFIVALTVTGIGILNWIGEKRKKRRARAALQYLPTSSPECIVPVEDDNFPDFWMQLEKELDQKLTRDEALRLYQYERLRQKWESEAENEWLCGPLDGGMQEAHSIHSVRLIASMLLHDVCAESDEEEEAS